MLYGADKLFLPLAHPSHHLKRHSPASTWLASTVYSKSCLMPLRNPVRPQLTRMALLALRQSNVQERSSLPQERERESEREREKGERSTCSCVRAVQVSSRVSVPVFFALKMSRQPLTIHYRRCSSFAPRLDKCTRQKRQTSTQQ